MRRKHLIGTSGIGLAYVEPLEAIVATIKSAGFQSLDFWLYLYSLEPQHPMLGDNWKEWVGETYRAIRETGLVVGQVHGILNTYIPDDFHFAAPGIEAYRNLEACRRMECERIVFHPAFYVHRVPDEDTRRRVLDYNVRWFGMLMDTARDFDVKIQLENTFDFARVQHPQDPAWPFTVAADILELMDCLGDHAQACLDTGHANTSGQDIASMIRAFGPRLKTIHLNDNFGRIGENNPDLHLFPGCGGIDWAPVFSALCEVGYDGVLNLEPVAGLSRLPAPVRRIQLQAAAESLRVMAELAGLHPA